ncbi:MULTISPECIES: hypothetical protein [Gordonia]|uniref:Uncharacterized protein n=1 Tax=Gordonia amicalis TaxID=89053 RepID=A0ABU4DL29_9ACTN|nr:MULTISPECIES: hypothetical protein [Gordonia]MBA5846251.1 hypothetical protein [Gordonia amicalis]MCZ0911721.1 hypothetical protein [Gordonia amicalis]MCZ4654324.1 hypothetical protein [Gordonia amicalis]MDJ0455374.1 hypothetical protein [Gordonia amicalis]MDV6310121.1 hypothetical protein [Gordonia amicalis]
MRRGVDGKIVALGEVTVIALDVERLALQSDDGVVELVDSLIERVPGVVHDILSFVQVCIATVS